MVASRAWRDDLKTSGARQSFGGFDLIFENANETEGSAVKMKFIMIPLIVILGVAAAALISLPAFAATEFSVTNSTDHKITVSNGKGQYIWLDPATSFATRLEATIEPAPGTKVEWIIVTDTGKKCTAAQGDTNGWDISAAGGTPNPSDFCIVLNVFEQGCVVGELKQSAPATYSLRMHKSLTKDECDQKYLDAHATRPGGVSAPFGGNTNNAIDAFFARLGCVLAGRSALSNPFTLGQTCAP